MKKQITLEVDDISLFAKAFNNAIASYGDIIASIYFRCEIPGKFLPLKELPQQELNMRIKCLKDVYSQIEQIEQELNYKEEL